jgi:hypothetical protein
VEELSAAEPRDFEGQPVDSQPTWKATTPAGPQRQLEKFNQAGAELAARLNKNQKRPKDKRLASKHVRINPNEPSARLGPNGPHARQTQKPGCNCLQNSRLKAGHSQQGWGNGARGSRR